MPQRALTPVLGAMIGAATEIDEAVENAAVSDRMRRLLHKAKREAFSTAGYQQLSHGIEAAEPGLWCEYDNAAWARDLARLGITRKYLWRLRVQAEALGFFTYHPDPEDPGVGYLRWNLDFDSWAALSEDYRRARSSRRGAGAPRGNQNARRRPAEENQSGVIRSLGIAKQSGVDANQSGVIRSVASKTIRRDTLASREAATEAAAAPPLRIRMEEGRTPSPSPAYAQAREDGGEVRPEDGAADGGAAMGGGAGSYDLTAAAKVTPIRTGTALDKLPPKLRAEMWTIVEALRLADDWKPSPKDADVVLQLVDGLHRPAEWIHRQALAYALDEGTPERPRRHTAKGFSTWCLNPIAESYLGEWESGKAARAAAAKAEGAKQTTAPKRQGVTDAQQPPARRANPPAAARTAPAPGAGRAPARLQRPAVSNGVHTDRRPLWEQD